MSTSNSSRRLYRPKLPTTNKRWQFSMYHYLRLHTKHHHLCSRSSIILHRPLSSHLAPLQTPDMVFHSSNGRSCDGTCRIYWQDTLISEESVFSDILCHSIFLRRGGSGDVQRKSHLLCSPHYPHHCHPRIDQSFIIVTLPRHQVMSSASRSSNHWTSIPSSHTPTNTLHLIKTNTTRPQYTP